MRASWSARDRGASLTCIDARSASSSAGWLNNAGLSSIAPPPACRRPQPSNLTAPALNTRVFRATIWPATAQSRRTGMQHYGLENVWQQGDFVTRAILVALLLVSLLSWTVIVLKLWNVMRLRRIARATERAFWHAGNLEAGLHQIGNDGSPYSGNVLLALALSGKEAVEHHQV